MIDKGPVLLDIADGIARLRLNRPDAANGMSAELLSALCDAIMVCHGQPDLRVLLLSGEGTNFCAGGDVSAFASKGEKLPDYIRQATAYLQNAVTGLLRLEAPVITSVQGFAAGGGGFGLVCASDIVIAGESAKFLAGATRVAMAPDAGVSVTLSRLVGLRRAMSILLTNPVISARRGAGYGHRHQGRSGCRTRRGVARDGAGTGGRCAEGAGRDQAAGLGRDRHSASSNACRKKRAPCPNCLGWPTRGKGSPPSSSGASPSLRDASQCRPPARVPFGRLDGRRAFVSGGAQGIGAAIVRSFADAGAHVVIADLDIDNGIRSCRAGWCDRGSSRCRRHRHGAGDHGAARAVRYRRQQCRRRPACVLHRHDAGRLGQAARGQSGLGLCLHPRRAAGDAGGRLRAHHQHHLGSRRGWARRVARSIPPPRAA